MINIGKVGNMNILTYIAVVLDPRNKEEVLDYVLDDIFGEGVFEKNKYVKDLQLCCLINIRNNIELLVMKKHVGN